MKENKQRISKKLLASILAIGIMSFCGVIVETAMNITFPTLIKEFNVSTATVQWMTTIYLLVVATIMPLSAFLKKRFKVKLLFVTANLLFIFGVFLDSISPDFLFLLIGRFIQGIGTGIALPLMFNIILEQVPSDKIGMMIGIGTLITAIAPAIGPTFGGIVVATIGWRFIFIFLLPILFVSLILGLATIKQISSTERVTFDFLSFFGIVLLFGGFIIGFSNVGTNKLFSLSVLGAWLIGFVGFCLLFWRSKNISQPLINFDVFKNLSFTGHATALFLLQLVSLGLALILPNYIQIVNGKSAFVSGLLLFPAAALGAVLAPLGGKILDNFGAKKPLMTGAFLTSISLSLFSIFSLYLTDNLILFIYIFYMASVGLTLGNLISNGLKQLPSKLNADGNAILNTLQQFAGAVGTSVVAAIITFSQDRTDLKEKISTALGSKNAFIFLLILAFIEFIIIAKVVCFSKKNNKSVGNS
ncbi:multidrug efflux MFS transporter [Oenococcus sp. UCMA 16435]|nr:multidrug efflux MFS transporter [Oenococcus sp. UCMA 16435]MDI4585252.1 MFS transporter [Oenococcus sp. UCMA 14587]